MFANMLRDSFLFKIVPTNQIVYRVCRHAHIEATYYGLLHKKLLQADATRQNVLKEKWECIFIRGEENVNFHYDDNFKALELFFAFRQLWKPRQINKT